MFHNILDKEETFFGDKNFIPLKSQKSHFFRKGVLTHGFDQNCYFFSLFVLGQKKAKKMFHNILDKEETFFGDKNFIPLKSQKSHFFRKGVNPWFCPKMPFFFFICFWSKKG